MLKKLMVLLIISMPIVINTGCGSVSDSGASSLFETATVSFTETGVSGATSTITALGTNTDDTATTATLTITVTPYPNFTASPFTIRNLQYIYTQVQGGTAVFIAPAPDFTTSLTFTQTLASAGVKDYLINNLGYSVTSPSVWTFQVQATYTVIEDNSGKSKNYSVPLGYISFI